MLAAAETTSFISEEARDSTQDRKSFGHPTRAKQVQMVDYDNVCFNLAAFVGGLFMLEFGADTFVDHTAKVASRLGVSSTLVALLTAGAEWEEV